MKRNAMKEIDPLALQHNFKKIKSIAPKSKIMAVIKADAYGHGAIKVATTLKEADAFGVASFEEALQLRRAGIHTPITLLSSYLTHEQIAVLHKENLHWVIHDLWQIELLKNTPLISALSVWLKIDTGMHRLGFLPHEAQAAWEALNQCPSIKKPIGLMTHFSCADELKNTTTTKQIHSFHQITQRWPGERSLANSAGVFAWPTSHSDWVRPGIVLYGISPFTTSTDKSHATGEGLGLKPVLTFKAPLIAIHHFKKGEPIGYNQTYICPQDMLVGVIGAGYADGYPRQAPIGTPIKLGNQLLPLVGRVSMDLITVDLSNYPEAQIGEEALLWGSELPIEIIAKHSGVFVYQLACGLKA